MVTENANNMWNGIASVLKEQLKRFAENLKKTDSRIRKVGGGMKISKNKKIKQKR